MNADPSTILRWLARLIIIGFFVTLGASLLDRVGGPLPWT